MAGYVGRLQLGETLSPEPYLQGPWKGFQRQLILAGDEYTLGAAAEEYSVFVTEGTGTVLIGDVRNRATTGTAITIGAGAAATFRADDGMLQLFITILRTPDAHAGTPTDRANEEGSSDND